MPEKHLNIISFTIPFPANYGGVIDVYYKLAALHARGIRLHLHCFRYNRETAAELEQLCESVDYYSRRSGLLSLLSFNPYIVQSRRSASLLNKLLTNNYPVLFEGLHSCYLLNSKSLRNRKLIYRESNIEHRYYYHLARAEKNIFRKVFFLSESLKLFFFQDIIKNASFIAAVTHEDKAYFERHFPDCKVITIPSFHGNEVVGSRSGYGKYALYHGNLSVPENYRAAQFLIKRVFNTTDIPLVIAGLDPPGWLKKMIRKYGNIELVANPAKETMERLIGEAQVNILITGQATGFKIKLIHALFGGRFVLANPAMVNGTGLSGLCTVAESPAGITTSLKKLFSTEFTEKEIANRQEQLSRLYLDQDNARKLTDLIFEEGD